MAVMNGNSVAKVEMTHGRRAEYAVRNQDMPIQDQNTDLVGEGEILTTP
jgi:hypothetical protein